MESLVSTVEDADAVDDKRYEVSSLKDAVDRLHDYALHFYDEESGRHCTNKWELVENEMTKVVDLLEKAANHYSEADASSQDAARPRFALEFLQGRARNILPSFDQKAQDHLSNAVKLDPTNVDAWNELGECYWKAGNLPGAKNCFSCALEKKRNKVSLRNLSVVLRQAAAKDEEERKRILFDGLRLAKEALQMDPSDGQSWLILGNSYLSVAFYSSQEDACVQKALAAYGQAEKYDLPQRNFNSADLFYNKATALICDEKFEEALANLDRSLDFDPSWELPRATYAKTTRFLSDLSENVAMKGKLKQRKLKMLLQSISTKDWGPLKASQLVRIRLQDLKVGINTGKFLLAKVIASVPCDGGSPFGCCVCDSETSAAAVTIYRLSQDYGLTIGDSILIPEPNMHMVDFSIRDKKINFPCVRVDSPNSILINGHALRSSQLATMFMKFSSVG